MPYQTTRITITFNGTPTVVHYWADGNGHHFSGYATSLRQIRKQLHATFGVPDLDLYCISNRRMLALTSDSHIRRAIHASRGDTLLITAYDSHYTDDSSEDSWPNSAEKPTVKSSSRTIPSQLRVSLLQAVASVWSEVQVRRQHVFLQRLRFLLYPVGLEEEAQVPRARNDLEN